MARGINKVILVGNLGKDPEVRYMPSGGAVANLTIATSESWKDKATGEQKELTEWHRVVMFGRLGEIAGEYLKKGSQVYIEGKLKTEKYQDKTSGQERFSTKIVADEMQMLGGRSGSGGSDFGGASQNSGYQSGGQPQSNTPRQQAPAPAANTGGNNNGFDDFDDDIPF